MALLYFNILSSCEVRRESRRSSSGAVVKICIFWRLKIVELCVIITRVTELYEVYVCQHGFKKCTENRKYW